MAQSQLFDLTKCFSPTTGPGSLTIGVTVPGFLSFTEAGVSSGALVSYTIFDGPSPSAGVINASETGQGTATLSGSTWTLARSTVRKSTNDNMPIICSGKQIVALTLAAEDIAALGNEGPVNVTAAPFFADNTGTTDAWAAIQAAIDSLSVTGGSIFLPTGRYMIQSPLLLTSNIKIFGEGPASLIVPNPTWVDTGHIGFDPYALISNLNYLAVTLVDQNIVVEDLAFDATPNSSFVGQGFLVRFRHAQNVWVLNNLGTGAGDFIAYLGCYNAESQGNVGYGQTNCPYDAWDGCNKIRVLGNYAEGPFLQAANFNASGGMTDPGVAKTSDGYICANNEFKCTNGGLFGTVNFDDLSTGDGSLSTNITIANNILYGVTIAGRGNVLNARIIGNTQIGLVHPAMLISAANGFTPSVVQILGNIVVNPQIPGLDVISCQCNGYIIDGNTVTGSNFVSAVATTTFVGIIGTSNQLSTGTSTPVRGSAWQSTLSDVQLPPNVNLRFFDSAGTYAFFENRTSDNNFLLIGRDSTGALINGFSWPQRATGAGFAIYPTVNLGVQQSNSVRIQGGSAGGTVPPTVFVNPNSVDTDVDLLIKGKGVGGVRIAARVEPQAPVVGTDIQSGQAILWRNTGDGSTKLYYLTTDTIGILMAAELSPV